MGRHLFCLWNETKKGSLFEDFLFVGKNMSLNFQIMSRTRIWQPAMSRLPKIIQTNF